MNHVFENDPDAAKASAMQAHEIHEVAHLFPEMSETEFSELKADISQHGLRMPILCY
jgi:hypothetical protein